MVVVVVVVLLLLLVVMMMFVVVMVMLVVVIVMVVVIVVVVVVVMIAVNSFIRVEVLRTKAKKYTQDFATETDRWVGVSEKLSFNVRGWRFVTLVETAVL